VAEADAAVVEDYFQGDAAVASVSLTSLKGAERL
jgi:hypothetical protein